MKNLITYLKALWSWVADSQRKKIGVTLGEGTIEHPFSTYSAPFGTCWQPSGKLHSVVRCAAMLVMLFTIGSGNAWADEVTLTYDGTGSFPRNSSWSSGGSESSTYKHSGTYCAMFATTSAQYITYNVDLTDISSITLWGYRNSSNTTHPTFAVEGSTDGGSSWTTLVAASTFTLTRYSWVDKTINISPAFTGRVRLKYSCGSTAQKFIDDVTITYTPSSSCSTNPTVGASTNSSINVTGGTVSCTGITKGDCDIDEWGFVYGTATEPTGNAQKVSSGKSTTNVSSFNKTLTGLDPNVKYYVRAYAKVGSSTFYGSETNFTTKTITASSSNTTYGTVSRNKMVITGSPKSGGQYASPAYTISGSTPANATTVSQVGNTFTVTSTSTTNITVTINFEAVPTYTVTWVAGSNSSFNSQTGTAGTALTNPGTPSAASYCPGGKVFVGWTATPIAGETNTVPTDLFTSVSGMSIPAENKTYYAVFAKVTTTYTKITTAADFTSGNYLVVNTANSKAMKAEIYSSNYLAAADVTISATTISNPAASLIWEVKKDGTTYTLYNTSVSKYCDIVESGSYGKMSLTASSKGFTASVSSGNWSLSSKNISGQMIRYNSSYTEFQAYNAIPAGYEIQLYKQGVSAYATTCCDNNVTLAHNSPSNGTVTFSPAGPIATCSATEADRQTTMTITPNAGYKLTGWSTTGVTPASVSPAVATSGDDSKSAQAITVTFTQNTTTGTYTANATFTAMVDHYIDKLHADINTLYDGDGKAFNTAGYSVPSLSNGGDPADDSCAEAHYKFVGWIDEAYVDTDGTLTDASKMFTATGTKNPSDTNFIAVWAKEL